MITTAGHQLDLPLAEAAQGGWIPYPLFRGATASLELMGCHVSVLSAGHMPHPPHCHAEEEILIILDGAADIVIATSPDDPRPAVHPLARGQFSYYPAWQHHTLRNNSARPVTYMMFKWVAAASGQTPALSTGTFDCRPLLTENPDRPFAPSLVFERPTGWLRRLHCHVSALKPGGGYAAHTDDYDVAIVVLAGEIEAGGQVLRDCGVVYFGKGTPHGMHNSSSVTARYLVFEFDTHGSS